MSAGSKPTNYGFTQTNTDFERKVRKPETGFLNLCLRKIRVKSVVNGLNASLGADVREAQLRHALVPIGGDVLKGQAELVLHVRRQRVL
jgi:hypothetical protein